MLMQDDHLRALILQQALREAEVISYRMYSVRVRIVHYLQFQASRVSM